MPFEYTLTLCAGLLSLAIFAACSDGPHPDRLKPPSQLGEVRSCENVQSVMDAMDDNSLWPHKDDMTIDEFLLVWDRDVDRIVDLFKLHCGPAFNNCHDASTMSNSFNPEFSPASMVVFFVQANEFLSEECY